MTACRINPEHGPAFSRGLCKPCYSWKRRHGAEPSPDRPVRCSVVAGGACRVPSCGRPAKAKGMCWRCYKRQERYGSVEGYPAGPALAIVDRLNDDHGSAAEHLALLRDDEDTWRRRVALWRKHRWISLGDADLLATLTGHHIDELWPQKGAA